ncbi:predicted protein [Arabidopsis lyrata subsp. lyrata]|uniref:Predicted protein n=1 Tax=Arabidopsis lyrata subsp. lyrata TaxID=81972 RepID=D7MXM9_ARALL|nr:predicted protein [Arabidopsis lyrata subsp. lyrata]
MVVSGVGGLRNQEKKTGSPSFDSKSFSYLQSSIIQADKCVSVEFLLFEEQASSLSYTQEKINRFLRCLSDLDKCSFQTCIHDGKSLHGLEKRWLQELKDDSGESLQAQIIFMSNIVGSVK